MSSPHPGRRALPAAVATLACAGLLAVTLAVAAAPIGASDLWWTLASGRALAEQGPELAADPCLHTAVAPPTPHQWLFALGLHALEGAVGLQGLRLAHAALVAAIALLAASLFRRASGSYVAAAFATCAFLVLSAYRLVQLRAELASIAATLLLYRWLVEPEAPPAWRRVLAAAALLGLLANLHALFALDLALVAGSALGFAVQAGLASRLAVPSAEAARDAATARRLAAAFALGLAATLANPRGAGAHLAFLASARTGLIWSAIDEWAPFQPFAHTNYPAAVGLPTWIATDLLLALVLGLGVRGAARLARRRDAASLRELDLVHLGLALAGGAALLVSIRFLWLGVFPLLYALRALGRALAAHPAARVPAARALAAASLALALAEAGAGSLRILLAGVPPGLRAYLRQPYDADQYFVEGVRFLRESGVEGRLFNAYGQGGFLCFELAPRLRTFVDGSMNFPNEVFDDYARVNAQRGSAPLETSLDVLERRGVDLFFGVGVPLAGSRSTRPTGLYTAANLERAPGWILVSRSFRHAIYLRADGRNRENVARIAAYYARAGVPFDPKRGLDVAAVIRERPDWAIAERMLPRDYPELRAALRSQDAAARARAQDTLGLWLALLGAYEEQVALDREAAALRPDAKAPLRRLVYGLLRLDRPEEALAAAERLRALDRGDPRSLRFEQIARRYAAAARRAAGLAAPEPGADAPINALPLVVSGRPLRDE
jgi:hypothetical protein